MMKKIRSKVSTVLCLAMLLGLTSCSYGDKASEAVEQAVNKTSTIGDIDTDTIKLSMNGSITEISCENFGADGINTDGIETFVNSKIEEFNTEKGNSKVSLVEYKEEDGVVKTAIQYSDIDTYNEFNKTNMFISVYSEAEADRIFAEDQEKNNKKEIYVEKVEVSEEDLADTGYSLEDIKAMQSPTATDASETDAYATFTDASDNSVVYSKDISDTSYMMLTTTMDVDVIINSGKVLYFNKYAELKNENTVDLSQAGVAVVVYEFDY